MADLKERLIRWGTGTSSAGAGTETGTGTGAEIGAETGTGSGTEFGTGTGTETGTRIGELPYAGVETVVLENREHLTAILHSGVVGADTLVLVPVGSGGSGAPEGPGGESGADGHRVVGYEGSLAGAGGEFSPGAGFYLQIQGYGISEYMSVAGPTLVRIADDTDFDVFLADADRALLDGTFPDFLTHPAIQLADLPGLGAGRTPAAGPRHRLYVGADGAVSTAPGGTRLGTAVDGPDLLDARWRRLNSGAETTCVVCLGAVVDHDLRRTALTARPWLGRYLAALGAIRSLRARGVDGTIRVSGFGGRITEALATDADADLRDADAPLLLWTDQDVYVHAPAPSRTFSVERSAATPVEALLACGSAEAAARYADPDHTVRIERFLTRAGV
ncbi:daptide biosynthesis RiPP recognition protein [Streptomyces bottropensis]|uniref:daptide biosynthesis RiPP recognition protein n=1 Tax=Streptomyces bottropensis TaxID=42235 RepID=UPI003686101A